MEIKSESVRVAVSSASLRIYGDSLMESARCKSFSTVSMMTRQSHMAAKIVMAHVSEVAPRCALVEIFETRHSALSSESMPRGKGQLLHMATSAGMASMGVLPSFCHGP